MKLFVILLAGVLTSCASSPVNKRADELLSLAREQHRAALVADNAPSAIAPLFEREYKEKYFAHCERVKYTEEECGKRFNEAVFARLSASYPLGGPNIKAKCDGDPVGCGVPSNLEKWAKEGHNEAVNQHLAAVEAEIEELRRGGVAYEDAADAANWVEAGAILKQMSESRRAPTSANCSRQDFGGGLSSVQCQ